MKRIFAPLVAALSLLCQGQLAYATELMPWTETDLLLYPRFDYEFQHYDKIKSSHHSSRKHGNDSFYTLGISGSYSVWSAEAEIAMATTEKRKFGFDCFRLTGRYQLMDDILDDPVSLWAGATYLASTKSAVDDISAFHHGKNGVEFHLSVGREKTCYDTWSSRWWTAGIYGIADQGCPWWKAIAAWEKRWSEALTFRFYAEGLLGMGNCSLHVESFHGYGGVKHRSVDLGILAAKVTECGPIWHIEYRQRVFAYNFPVGANIFKISFIYPFSL